MISSRKRGEYEVVVAFYLDGTNAQLMEEWDEEDAYEPVCCGRPENRIKQKKLKSGWQQELLSGLLLLMAEVPEGVGGFISPTRLECA